MNLKYFAGALIIIAVASVPLFGHLSALHLHIWDESRLAANAIEMYHNHQWLVPTFMDEPEMWNTKPPLMIWLQVLTMHLVGINELAVRLPAALAAMATCLFLYWFLAVKMRNNIAAFAAPALLVIYEGYVCHHGTRTGDYDALLAFFTTAFMLYYFLYLHEQKSRYILLTAVMVIGAALTKGVHGLIFTPVLLLATISYGRMKSLLRTKELYIGLALFIIFVPGYYLLREQVNPGYLEAVANNELGGRFMNTMEEHKEKWSYYFELIHSKGPLILFLALAALNVLWAAGDRISALTRYLAGAILFFVSVLSLSQTKLYWYVIPVYPLICILAGIGVDNILGMLKNGRAAKYKYILPVITFGIFYYLGYSSLLGRVVFYKPNFEDRDQAVIRYLQMQHQSGWQLGKAHFLNQEFRQDFVWYMHTADSMSFKDLRRLEPGDKVILYTDEIDKRLRKKYSYELLEQWYAVRVYRITGNKYLVNNHSESHSDHGQAN